MEHLQQGVLRSRFPKSMVFDDPTGSSPDTGALARARARALRATLPVPNRSLIERRSRRSRLWQGQWQRERRPRDIGQNARRSRRRRNSLSVRNDGGGGRFDHVEQVARFPFSRCHPGPHARRPLLRNEFGVAGMIGCRL